MSKSVAVFGFHANPTKDRPMHHLKRSVVNSLIERGFVALLSKYRAQYIARAFDYAPVKHCHGSHVESRVERCGALGESRALSGGLMSPGIGTTGPRNIAKIPHEMSPYFQGR